MLPMSSDIFTALLQLTVVLENVFDCFCIDAETRGVLLKIVDLPPASIRPWLTSQNRYLCCCASTLLLCILAYRVYYSIVYRVFGIVQVARFAPTSTIFNKYLTTCYYGMLCSSMYTEGMPLSLLVTRRTGWPWIQAIERVENRPPPPSVEAHSIQCIV